MPEPIDFQTRFASGIASQQAPAGGNPEAFAVYRNTWLKGLLDALDANYPVIAMLLGPEVFHDAALDFARQHPAKTPVLALYGEGFADFLARHPLGHEISYLRDVAALERLWTESFFAPDANALVPQQYAALRPAQLLGLRAGLHPAARVARFETPAVTIWQAHRADGEFEELEPEWCAEQVLVTRQRMSVSVMLLDDAAYRVLLEIRRGQTIGSAVESAAEACPAADLARALAIIIESGALVGDAQSQRG